MAEGARIGTASSSVSSDNACRSDPLRVELAVAIVVFLLLGIIIIMAKRETIYGAFSTMTEPLTATEAYAAYLDLWSILPFGLQLSIVSANVLALDTTDYTRQCGRRVGVRTQRWDAQWHARGIHLLGLQEARTPPGVFHSEHYKIW